MQLTRTSLCILSLAFCACEPTTLTLSNSDSGCLQDGGCETPSPSSTAWGCDSARCDPNEVCVAGQCSCGGTGPNCNAPDSCCGGVCANLNSDLKHCGSCGNACEFPNSQAECVNGQCRLSSCLAGFANCSGQADAGCATNLKTDVLNCGSCGNRCPSAQGQSACVNGVCQLNCQTGWANCSGNPSNGCTTPLRSDVNNCGACGNKCQFPRGTGSCMNGVCVLNGCEANWGNCDFTLTNGCETNLLSTFQHCGGCGRSCNDFFYCTNDACRNGVCENVAPSMGIQNLCQSGQRATVYYFCEALTAPPCPPGYSITYDDCIDEACQRNCVKPDATCN